MEENDCNESYEAQTVSSSELPESVHNFEDCFNITSLFKSKHV